LKAGKAEFSGIPGDDRFVVPSSGGFNPGPGGTDAGPAADRAVTATAVAEDGAILRSVPDRPSEVPIFGAMQGG